MTESILAHISGTRFFPKLLAFLNLYQHEKNQLISSINSWDTADFRVSRPKRLCPFPTNTIQKLLKKLWNFLNFYQHTKNQLTQLIPSWDKANFSVLRPEKTPFLAHFGPIFPVLGAKKIFMENLALSRTTSYGFLEQCQNVEKVNNTIQRKHPGRQKDGRTDLIL